MWYYDQTNDSRWDTQCMACFDLEYLSIENVSNSTQTMYNYTCGDSTSSKAPVIEGCSWATSQIDPEGSTPQDFCIACGLTFYPEGLSTVTSPNPLKRHFTSCSSSITNPWTGDNCFYMGMDEAGAIKCYACDFGFVLNYDETNCISYEGIFLNLR